MISAHLPAAVAEKAERRERSSGGRDEIERRVGC